MAPVRTSLLPLAAVFAGVLTVSGALAQPQVPATFYGSATVDGRPAESGTEVRGLVGGVDCTQSAPGERPVLRDGDTAAYVLYVVHDSQRPGCARDGSTVTFTIGGRAATQTAIWKPGPIRLDLSTGAEPPIPLPSPTGTIAAAIGTAVGATVPPPTSTALARPTGPPPTDDVTFGTASATSSREAGGAPGGEGDDGDGGSAVLSVIFIGVAALAAAGGGLGIYLAGRGRPKADDAGA